jgi:NAD+ synthase (glutamine-hydrolysing)
LPDEESYVKWIKVGAAVLNQTPLDWKANQRNIEAALDEADRRGVSLLCLPELCTTGYGCDDAFQSPGVQQSALDMLFEVMPKTQGKVVALGLPLQYRKALFDAVAVIADAKLLGFVAKRYLAGDGLYYEPRWFKPWPERRLGEIDLGGATYPIGDLFFVCDGVNIGFEICEEAWVARRPGASLAARGVDILLNPSASHFSFGKHEVRRRFVQEGSRAFGVAYIYSNLAGNASGRMIFDGGALIAADGNLLAEGPRFSFAEMSLTTAAVDVDDIRLRQVRTGSFQPDFEPHPGERIVAADFRFPDADSFAEDQAEPDAPLPWQILAEDKEEELAHALPLALFDYLRKSRSRGCVVSLSGGADSAAVSALVSMMWRLAEQELGMEELRRRLPFLDWQGIDDVDALIRRTLLTVYQATRNSSQTTRDAAATVAAGVGAEFLEIDVDALVGLYVGRIEGAIGRQLSWEKDDLALQNIQARVRAPGVWLLANLRGFLLLATSNRSEAAVGYATMDGDTAGGLSPIAGIDKAYLRRWLRWLETTGPRALGPIPALQAVNKLAPTAELRPAEDGQTDEKDLMPYPLLDEIEREAIGGKKMPVEIYVLLRRRHPEIERRQLGVWVERFFRLWCRNQWKRERYAPSFHLDDENLDPKTWCRFPILSGGFEREIGDLRAYIEQESAG